MSSRSAIAAFLPFFASCALLLPAGPASSQLADASHIDPETLIRRIVKAQRLSERRLASYTFDQLEVETTYDKRGLPKETHSRLFYVLNADDASGSSRELAEVDGRPATDAEKKEAAEQDAEGRKQRLEREAARRAQAPPTVKGDEEDPLVGTRRLSDLIARYDYTIAGEVVVEGRPTYVLDFTPKSGLVARGLGDKALNALAGRALIDASDFQIRKIDARLIAPLKVMGGVGANVSEAVVTYEAHPVRPEQWLPCVVDLRVKGKKALLFRLDTGYRFELGNFQTFAVTADAEAFSPVGPGEGRPSAAALEAAEASPPQP